MLGFHRDERGQELMGALNLVYDKGLYTRLANEKKLENLSFKQVAIDMNVQKPLFSAMACGLKAAHMFADNQKSRSTTTANHKSITDCTFDGTERAKKFQRNDVDPTNIAIISKLSPYLGILQQMANGTGDITKGDRVLTMMIETDLREKHDCRRREVESLYYYEPVQKLWVMGNGGKYQVI